MATVQVLRALLAAHQERSAPLRDEENAIVREANASGKPDWTPERQARVKAIREAMKPLIQEYNT